MPAKRRLTESQAEAFRILCGFTRRRQLLASLEKERLSVERRLLELASRPAEQLVSPCAQANGYHWLHRTEDMLRRDIALAAREQALYDELLDCLDPFQRQIVRLRHEENKSWCAVAHRVYLCERQAQRVYRTALERMGERLAG